MLTNFGDNYIKFINFCNIQPNRNSRLATSIIDRIDLADDRKSISVLDIGSSDGKIIPYLVDEILKKNNDLNIKIVAIEPDNHPFQVLEKLTFSDRVNFNARQLCFENFSKSAKLNGEKFDLIIGTHVFYHFNDWHEVVNDIMYLLNPNGRAIITIDSIDSPIYQNRSAILESLDKNNNIELYGKYAFAEDLEDLFKNLYFSKTEILSNLAIELSSNIQYCKLIDSISFLHRININSITEREKIRSLFSEYNNDMTCNITWKEFIFTIDKISTPTMSNSKYQKEVVHF
jgi:SAM-dependent methyltransferase